VISALRMYGEGLRAGPCQSEPQRVRLSDGTLVPLPLERYLGRADVTDELLLQGLEGPVLDVGCGPGRHLHALAAHGVFALGVDLSPVAVELAVGRGARAIVGDVFGELPGGRSWRNALLLDGNIGIGGSPVRLLDRIGGLLQPGGGVIVELERPGARTYSTEARLERGGAASGWFPWARVGVSAMPAIARAAGFTVVEVRSVSGRWVARLSVDSRPVP
jgi:SAM-dependent methyltransferase